MGVCTLNQHQEGQKLVDLVVVARVLAVLLEMTHLQAQLKEMLVVIVLENQVVAAVVLEQMGMMLPAALQQEMVVRDFVLLVETLEFQIVMEKQDHSLVDILLVVEAVLVMVAVLMVAVVSVVVAVAERLAVLREIPIQEVVAELAVAVPAAQVVLELLSLDIQYKN
tara:strand:- start:46 stop:546 length:501 start_codon:yes stop_codon:yes gene_type:complete